MGPMLVCFGAASGGYPGRSDFRTAFSRFPGAEARKSTIHTGMVSRGIETAHELRWLFLLNFVGLQNLDWL
jgi:hypothetical protein